jgi:hypothetical protein
VLTGGRGTVLRDEASARLRLRELATVWWGAKGVERDQLDRLLAARGGEDAFFLARRALTAGAEFAIKPSAVASEHLASIYRRRERHARRAGQATVGFSEAIADLQENGEREIAGGFIDDRPREGYYYQLFLSLDLSAVIACLGIKPS